MRSDRGSIDGSDVDASRDCAETLRSKETPVSSVVLLADAGPEIRVGVVGANSDWVDTLRAELSTLKLELAAVTSLVDETANALSSIEWDVVLAFLSASSLHALSEVLTMHDRLGFPEIVAVSEYQDDVAAIALREFGVGRILARDLAPAWLASNLEPLATVAHAKRLLRKSRAALGEPDRVDARPGDAEILPLSVAEGRFREAYLRGLMAGATSRTQAAERARVPYRTLCYMLDRFGIR